jgi:hypothetical protein
VRPALATVCAQAARGAPQPLPGRVVAEFRPAANPDRTGVIESLEESAGAGRTDLPNDQSHAGQRSPELPDRLVGVLLARIVQTDALLGGDEAAAKFRPSTSSCDGIPHLSIVRVVRYPNRSTWTALADHRMATILPSDQPI